MSRRIMNSASAAVRGQGALLAGTAMLLALGATPALGETKDAKSPTVETVVVTAQRRAEENIKVPVAVTAISATEIQNITAGQVTDVGIKAPNVFMSPGAISPQISIRGVSSQSNINAGFPPAVGVYVDEVYQGRDPTFNTILNDIQRIEVLRGPQGTLYGKNTIGGAINIVTGEPSNDFTGFGDLQFGNYGFGQVRATVNVAPITDKLMLRASVAHRYREGFLSNTLTGEKLGDQRLDAARISLGSHLTDNLKIKLEADYLNSIGTDALETGPVVFPAPTPAVLAAILPQSATDNVVQLNSPEFSRRKVYGFMGRADLALGWADLTSITSKRRYFSSFHDDSDGLPLDAFDVGREENGDNFSQEFRLTSNSQGPFTWIVGAYYYSEHTQNIRDIHVGPDMPVLLLGGRIPGYVGERGLTYSTIDARSYAGFASGTWRVTDHLRLAGGLRWTREDKKFFYSQGYPQTFLNTPNGLLISNFAVKIPGTRETYRDNQWTGDASVSYDFDEEHTTYLKYSRGYKAGGFQTDVISPPFNATDPLGFKPEFVNNYEAGYKAYYFDRRLSLNVAAFYLKWTDKQEQIFTGLSFLIRNAATASSRGVELELTARPTEHLTLDANAAWLNAKYDSFPTNPALSGKNFQSTPKESGSVGVQYVTPIMSGLDLFARADVIYRGKSYFLNNASTPVNLDSFTMVNGRLGVESSEGGWGAYLWGKNLTNEKVLGSGSTFPFPKAVITTRNPAFGRTYGVELRKKF